MQPYLIFLWLPFSCRAKPVRAMYTPEPSTAVPGSSAERQEVRAERDTVDMPARVWSYSWPPSDEQANKPRTGIKRLPEDNPCAAEAAQSKAESAEDDASQPPPEKKKAVEQDANRGSHIN